MTSRATFLAAGRGPAVVRRLLLEPDAAKVPEILAVFWLVKLLATAGGEAASSELAHYGNIAGGGAVLLVFLVGVALQFGARRYHAVAYWFFAYAIAIFGTAMADFLHLDVGIPYAGTSALWAVVLAAVFLIWFRSEGTLSIHSVTTRRREYFYWATVFATFALGTALGDYTALALKLGYLVSVVLFAVVILIPLAAWLAGANAVGAFWFAYVLTRPLGASIADYVSKPPAHGGAGFGDGPTTAVLTVAVALLVAYLAATRPDVQHPDPQYDN